MKLKAIAVICVLALAALPTAAQMTPMTPKSMVEAYDSLADTVLAVRAAEAGLVRAILDGHRHAAEVLANKGDWEGAAAEIAIFANEGDNAVGGVRKRLLEGGHHYNADEEEAGVYEPGYVIVTAEAKKKLLEISAAMRKAMDDAGRKKAWNDFAGLAEKLLKKM